MARQRFDMGSKWLLHNQGKRIMFESPVLQNFVAKRFHQAIIDVLKDCFGRVPHGYVWLFRRK